MNNPAPMYFEHPDKSVRFIEWTALNKLHFKSKENRLGTNISIYEAYPEYDQRWFHWQDNFNAEIKKKANSPKHKLYLKIVNGELTTLDEVYVELKRLSKPTLRGKSLKQAKKKVAQSAYAREKYGVAFIDNKPLVSAVKSAASEMAFKSVALEDMVAKISQLVGVHSPDERLSEEQINNTLVGLCQRRIKKLEALDAVEAKILEYGDDDKKLLFLWVKIRRHYEIDETIIMSEKEWAAFGKLSKGRVKPLLTALCHKKLGALTQIKKGRVGSNTGIASEYKRLV